MTPEIAMKLMAEQCKLAAMLRGRQELIQNLTQELAYEKKERDKLLAELCEIDRRKDAPLLEDQP